MNSSTSNSSTGSTGSSLLAHLSVEQQQRLSEVLERYLSALEEATPLDQRQLLDANPDLSDALREHFRSLEDLHCMAAGFSAEEPVRDSGVDRTATDSKCIGDYQLLREIGRGGMGVVYEARQISLDRRVAVKLLPFAAVLDAKQIARFKAEAQAAAQVQHPNIVPVFAIGVERGVHYYAMQYVEGQPLDRAIEELRAARWRGRNPRSARGKLPVAVIAPRDEARVGSGVGSTTSAPNPMLDLASSFVTRSDDGHDAPPVSTRKSVWDSATESRKTFFETAMRLGIQAAEALHAAHEYGVVHRDIKPSNLLVDWHGKLWVTDFGLARCQRDVSLTKTGDVVGTMRYMSPEQASGKSALVDERTDIYSLGVTLYELLCLRPAFPEQTSVAMLRDLDRHEPLRPRQLQADIPRDLETVVLKAMAKSRDDRYLTAQQFAEDLRRVLEGKPTLAKPPGMADRLVRWSRRHRRTVGLAVAASVTCVVALVVSLFLIAREKNRAERNLARADAYFHDARNMLDRFGVQLAERLADVPGAEQVRQDLLHETLGYYQNFVAEAQDDPDLRSEMALTYGRVATLTDAVGSPSQAVAAHEKTTKAYAELAARHPDQLAAQRHLALSTNNLGLALSRAGRTDEAMQNFTTAIRLQERLTRDYPGEDSVIADCALSLSNLGLVQNETGRPANAQVSYRSAIELLRQLLTKNSAAKNSAATGSANRDLQRKLGGALNNLAATHLAIGPQEAIRLHKEALGYQIELADSRPSDFTARREVALTYNNLGAASARNQQLDDAVRYYGQAVTIHEELFRLAPSQRVHQRDLAISHNNLGLIHNRARQSSKAEEEFRRALALQKALIQEHPDDPGLQSSLGGVHNNLGILWEESGKLDLAAEEFRNAIVHQRRALDQAPDVARFREFLSKHYFNHGRVLRDLGKLDLAAEQARMRRSLWVGKPEHLASVAEELAQVYGRLGSGTANISEDECAKLVVDTLQQAVTAGWQVPRDLARRPHFSLLNTSTRFLDWTEKVL